MAPHTSLPKKGRGAQPEVSNILLSAAGRGQPVPRATLGGRGLQGKDGRAPARRDLQQRGHTREGQSHHPAATGDSRAPRWLRAGWGDKTPQDIEAQRKGHYPPRPQAHTQSVPKHAGIRAPVPISTGRANKSKPQQRLGDSRGGERAQLLSGAGKEPRTEGEAATGRGEHPQGRGTPLRTPYLPAGATHVSGAATEANPGAHGGCRKDMASR